VIAVTAVLPDNTVRKVVGARVAALTRPPGADEFVGLSVAQSDAVIGIVYS